MRTNALLLAMLVLTTLASSDVLARQDDAEPPGPARTVSHDGLTFTFTPTLYIPRLGGNATLGPSSVAPPIDFENDIDLRDRDYVFNPELTIATDSPWQFFVHGLVFEVDGSGSYMGLPGDFGSISLAPGDAYRASLELTTVMGEIGYLFWEWHRDDHFVEFEAGPVLDLRWVEVEQTLSTASGRERPDGQWFGVLGGIKVNFQLNFEPGQVPILHTLAFDGAVAVGPALGGDGGTMWNLRVGLTGYVTDDIGLLFGYRLIEIDAEDGDYEFAGGLQGLVFGASIRF